mgnify:FL=1
MINWFLKLFGTPNIETFYEKDTKMLNLVLPAISNMLIEFIKDEATDFAKETLEKHVKQLPPDVAKAIDDAIDGDSTHEHKSLIDMASKI